MPDLKSHFQSAAVGLLRRVGVRTVTFEVTQRCNQDCVFCYNVWKSTGYPTGECPTERAREILDRILRGYRPQVITLTGGEPLLRPDIVDLVSHASCGSHCNLITNGTLMTDSLARDLVRAGVRTFEFTLLSADRETHNRLVGRDSSDSVIEAIASVRAAGGVVATTFVATRSNIEAWEETLELNVALGVSGVLFNRFNVGGAGIKAAVELMPTAKQLETALRIANEGARRYGISISCGVPIPPCVIDRNGFRDVHFTDCSAGTRNAYPTVDPLGNVRPCNHSATILGNLFDADLRSIVESEAARSYCAGVPAECVGCEHSRTCRGGCRAAAEVCGDCGGVDPFVRICGSERGGQPCATPI